MTVRDFRIDVIKAVAVISVIIIHSMPLALHFSMFSLFHVMQAVPLFYVLLGYNAGLGKPKSIKQFYKKRVGRVILPFLIIFLCSVCLGLLVDGNIYFGWLTLIGYLPFTGPGNYFISVLFQFILITPFLVYLFNKSPKLLFIGCVLLSLVFELISGYFHFSSYLYNAAIFRSLPAIVIVLWIVRKPKSIINVVCSVGAGVSILYFAIILLSFENFSFIRTQNILSYFYAAFLVIFAFKILPTSSGRIWNFIALIGKSSYHIYLVQMLYFIGVTVFPLNLKLSALLINLLFCVGFGVIFYLIDNSMRSKVAA